jgi:hypothetical protein
MQINGDKQANVSQLSRKEVLFKRVEGTNKEQANDMGKAGKTSFE